MNYHNLLEKLKGLTTREVKLGHGSFITMGFGSANLEEAFVLYKKQVTKTRPAWFLWVYMADWELIKQREIITHSNDPRSKITAALACLEGKKLLDIKILSEMHDLSLAFEDNISLNLIANNDETDNEQWLLFTPEKKVLVAGPFQKITYEEQGSNPA